MSKCHDLFFYSHPFHFLPIFLLFVVATAQVQPLQVDKPMDYPISLEFDKKITLSLLPASTGYLLVEYFPSSPLADYRTHGLPNLLLSVSAEEEDPFTTSRMAKDVNEDKKKNYQCSQINPCFKKGPVVDAEAFYNRATRAFVNTSVAADAKVFVTLHNFKRLFLWDNKEVTPKVIGTLRITLTEEDICPGYLSPEKSECYGEGDCVNRECNCRKEYEGRLCEAKVLEMKNERIESKDDWITQFPEDYETEGVKAEVHAFNTSFYKWKQEKKESHVRVFAYLLKGFVSEDYKDEHKWSTPTRLQMWARIKAGTDSNDSNVNFLDNGPELPGVYYEKSECDGDKIMGRQGFFYVCLLKKIMANKEIRIAIHANATGSVEERPSSVITFFFVDRCGREFGLSPCYIESGGYLPFIVLPIGVVLISATGLAILFLLWLDRRYGFTSPVDRLSQKELDRMYPTGKFRAGEGSDNGEVEACLICLSYFGRDDVVRNLQCDHTFHSECLDPWLIQNNASCPTCRAPVRLEHLSDKRRLRRTVLMLLWPIVYMRRRRERRELETAAEARERVVDTGDIEAGRTNAVAHSPVGDGMILVPTSQAEVEEDENENVHHVPADEVGNTEITKESRVEESVRKNVGHDENDVAAASRPER